MKTVKIDVSSVISISGVVVFMASASPIVHEIEPNPLIEGI